MIVIIISLILSFIFGALLMFLVFCIVMPLKEKKPKNNIHFYVARDKNDELFLYIGKPFRGINKFHECQTGYLITSDSDFPHFGLNKDDYSNLKWEDKPIEVFVNTEE